MCTAAKGTIATPTGRRNEDGSFTRDSQLGIGAKWADRHSGGADMNATNVPLGDGLVDSARLSILSRRERIRKAAD